MRQAKYLNIFSEISEVLRNFLGASEIFKDKKASIIKYIEALKGLVLKDFDLKTEDHMNLKAVDYLFQVIYAAKKLQFTINNSDSDLDNTIVQLYHLYRCMNSLPNYKIKSESFQRRLDKELYLLIENESQILLNGVETPAYGLWQKLKSLIAPVAQKNNYEIYCDFINHTCKLFKKGDYSQVMDFYLHTMVKHAPQSGYKATETLNSVALHGFF